MWMRFAFLPSEPAHGSSTPKPMDLTTRLLLGVTALAALGYVSFVYGSCAGDPDCHLRSCGRQLCGVVYSHRPAP